MSYEYLTQYNALRFTPNALVQSAFGYARVITNITIHWWGRPEWKQKFEDVIRFFCELNSTQTSAHEVISDGMVACIVDHSDAAWANGNSRGNAQSITLECNPRMSAGDFETVCERVADIWIMHGQILPVTEHRDWFATECCGTYRKGAVAARALQIYEAKKGGKTAITKVAEAAVNSKGKDNSMCEAANELWALWRPGKENSWHAGPNYAAIQNISRQTQELKDALTPGISNVKNEGSVHALLRQTLEAQRENNELLKQLIEIMNSNKVGE